MKDDGYRVERLGATHDRSDFDCGVPELDNYFRYQAGQDIRRRAATCFVMVDRRDAIAGYYTLSAYSLGLAEVPERIRKKLPRYPRLPATLLGRLAVHRAFRGRGVGGALLVDALKRALKNTSEVGSVAVIVDALDEAARQFYLHHQFETLEDHPNKLYLLMATIQKMFESS